jgi:hypothetical protein
MQSKTSSSPRLTLRISRPVRSLYRSSFFCAVWWASEAADAAARSDVAECLIALPGSLTAEAAAAASALRAADSLSCRDLISDLESVRAVVRSVSLVWRVEAWASAVSRLFWRRAVSLEASFWAASSALRLAMSWSAAVKGGG